MENEQQSAAQAAQITRREIARLQAADEDPVARQRHELIHGIARIQGIIAKRRIEQAADEGLLAGLFGELEALERRQARQATAIAPAAPLWLTLKEGAGLARCSPATLKAKARLHGFGECRDGRWRIVRDELVAYLCNARTSAGRGF